MVFGPCLIGRMVGLQARFSRSASLGTTAPGGADSASPGIVDPRGFPWPVGDAESALPRA